jgi:hypothetical protein
MNSRICYLYNCALTYWHALVSQESAQYYRSYVTLFNVLCRYESMERFNVLISNSCLIARHVDVNICRDFLLVPQGFLVVATWFSHSPNDFAEM